MRIYSESTCYFLTVLDLCINTDAMVNSAVGLELEKREYCVITLHTSYYKVLFDFTSNLEAMKWLAIIIMNVDTLCPYHPNANVQNVTIGPGGKNGNRI